MLWILSWEMEPNWMASYISEIEKNSDEINLLYEDKESPIKS